MADTMDLENRHAFGNMSPEGDLRSSVHQQQSQYHYPGLSDFDFSHPMLKHHGHTLDQSREMRMSHSHFTTMDGNLDGQDYNSVHRETMHNGFDIPNGHYGELLNTTANSAFSPIMADQDLAAALASFQSCDDCTPSSKTTIPHHHHPSGRLAGVSATLDGHYCCSWLEHDQPCFMCFQSAEALDNHIKTDHAGKDGSYRCLWQDCSKHDDSTQTAGPVNFGNKPKLMRHVHSHTGYKPFPCPYPGCDKGFVTKEQLKNHETTHSKSRKYKCDQCGKAFAVKSALTTHITAVHDEKKTHRCDICGKAFADSSNLSKHKQTHFRENGIRKQRSTRATSNTTSTRSSPSIATPYIEPATPIVQIPYLQELAALPMSLGLMGPPAIPKLPNPLTAMPTSNYRFMSTTSTTSSPPPESFDPDCYCCEQQCPPPAGPPTPCNETDDCNRDGFCDLPDCLAQNGYTSVATSPGLSVSAYHCGEGTLGHHQMEQMRNFQMPSHWDDMMEQDAQRSFSQRELEEEFTNMHGS